MSNLRIVNLITNSNQGGAQHALFRLSKELQRRGHEVEIWFMYGHPNVPEGLPTVRTLMDVAQPGPIGYLRVFARVLKRLRRERPDAVISFLPLASVMGQTGARLAGVRSRIASQRNPYWSYSPIMRACDWLAGSLGMYTANVGNSRYVIESFAKFPRSYRRRLALVNNGIDWRPSALGRPQARRKFALPPEATLVVTVGRLVEQKNQTLLLKAIARLPKAELVLAGDGELRQALADEARQLGISDRVRFLGKVDATDIPDLLRASDIFALPSRYEGQSNALLEAMSEGLPVVVSDLLAQAETIRAGHEEPAGWLLPMDDPDSWAQVIGRLSADPSLRERMGNLAREHAATYSLERMGRGFEQVIRSSLDPDLTDCRSDLDTAPHRPPGT